MLRARDAEPPPPGGGGADDDQDWEGGAAFCDWFGGTPTLHDATIRELEIRQGSGAKLVADGFAMTSETDARDFSN